MNEEYDDLIPEFLAEASELIEKVYQELSDLSGDELPVDQAQAVLNSLFRNIHTVKGGCGMFGFNNTQQVAHDLETYLSNLKSSETPDLSASGIQYIREKTQIIEALLENKDEPSNEETKSETIETSSTEPVLEEVSKEPLQQEISAPQETQSSQIASTEIKEEQSSAKSSSSNNIEYIRVPVDRINDSISEISEIFLIRNQMVHLMGKKKKGELDEHDFFQSWDQLDAALRRAIGEIENSTMNMRMAPVKGLFSRMARVIQSYKSENKKIQFTTHGDSTELDKKVLDTLAEPLVHLIRNAMDHGIETIDVRSQHGKPAIGTINLKARIFSNEAIIEISDDGKGLDPHKIMASAQDKGLDISHVTDDKAAIELIFLPGFSTAQAISEISGRGVGMDAVKTSVQSLGGKIHIQSKVGIGSTFTIHLPVSVSVSPVVIVNIRGYKYAIPNQDILEIRQTSITAVQNNNGKKYVKFRDVLINCIDLREVIEQEISGHEEKMSEASFLFFQHGDSIVAAQVSSFDSNTEIVVKPTSSLIPRIPWISGVSVLPTGEPIFVIALDRIFESRTEEIKYAG